LKRRFWIPPIPLAAGIAFQCLAWSLVLVHAVHPSFGIELAWVHAVALGWLTVVALAVLLHVIPGFTDLAWRAEDVARGTVLVICVAAFALVFSFATSTPGGVAFAGGALAIWAVVLAAAGLNRPTFPGGMGGARGVVGLTVILVVLVMAAAVTSG